MNPFNAGNDEVVLQIPDHLDWLPPRPSFPGTRLFSMCCSRPSQDDVVTRDLDTYSFISEPVKLEETGHGQIEDIPDLESFSSFSDDDSARVSAKSLSIIPNPKRLQHATHLLLEFCKLVFAMVILDNAMNGKKGKRR